MHLAYRGDYAQTLYTNNDYFLLNTTYSGGQLKTSTLQVNGHETYSGSIFLKEGENLLQLTAVDIGNGESTFVSTIIKDTISPLITTSFKAGQTLTTANTPLKFNIIDTNTTSFQISVNGLKTTPSSSTFYDGLIELNEAFASQGLAVMRELGLEEEITNVNGGAIALGHPLGCTGAKLTTQLIFEMKRRDVQFGLVTMCIGGGMGAAGIFENIN